MRMKKTMLEKVSTKREIKAAINSIGPLAKGALSLVRKTCGKPTCKACQSGEGHPAWIFTFRREGKLACMHVRLRDVETVRKAIENGRLVEQLVLEAGEKLIERLRKVD